MGHRIRGISGARTSKTTEELDKDAVDAFRNFNSSDGATNEVFDTTTRKWLE